MDGDARLFFSADYGLGRQRLLIAAALALVFTLVPSTQQADAQTPGLEVSPIDGDSVTPDDLANTLVGPGVTISNVNYSGVNEAAGLFSGGSGIIGFDSGIVLTSGLATNVVGPNSSDGISANNGAAGDAQLAALNGQTSLDASVLQFEFEADGSVITFEYVFASDEYNEFVGSNFDDVFAFFIDGFNCATVGGQRVSVNTINQTSNASMYRNNDLSDGGGAINTEMDGLTVVLTCTVELDPEITTHTLKLAIADSGDPSLDSAVFLRAASLVSPEVDLSVTKTTEQSSVTVGDIVTYVIDVSNADEVETATNVVLTDTLAGPGEIDSADGCLIAEDGKSATCDIGELSSGATEQFTVTVATNEPGSLVNSVSVTSEEADLNSEDNQFTAATVVVEEPEDPVDLSISKDDTPGPDPVSGGANVAYTIEVTNSSEDLSATGVTITDTPPTGAFLATTGSHECWEPPIEGPGLVCFVGDLDPGETASRPLVLTMPTVEVETVVTNTAVVFGDQVDPNEGNNTDSADTTVVPSSEDEVTGFVPPGGTLTTDNGMTSPANPVSAQIQVPEDGTAGIYTLGEFTDTSGASKGAVEYTAPENAEEFFIVVSCDESKCPVQAKKDTFLLVKKLNPDGTEVVLSSCQSTTRVRGEPTIIERAAPCVVSVVRNPNSGDNPLDLVWTVKVVDADPIIKAR